MMTTPPWDEIDRLVGEGMVLSTNKNVPYINFIHLNLKNPALQDVQVRQAINMAIDREGIAQGSITPPAGPKRHALARHRCL